MHPYPYTGVVAAKVSDPCQTFIRKCLMSDDLKKKKTLGKKKNHEALYISKGPRKKEDVIEDKIEKIRSNIKNLSKKCRNADIYSQH